MDAVSLQKWDSKLMQNLTGRTPFLTVNWKKKIELSIYTKLISKEPVYFEVGKSQQSFYF